MQAYADVTINTTDQSLTQISSALKLQAVPLIYSTSCAVTCRIRNGVHPWIEEQSLVLIFHFMNLSSASAVRIVIYDRQAYIADLDLY